MKILITGAAGGIGSTLGYELYKKGHTMFLVDNFRNGYKENLRINGEKYGVFFEVDISDFDSFYTVVKDTSPDVIVHLAAITALPDCEVNKTECIEINVGGTQKVLEAARLHGIKRVVFSSTSAVYENTTQYPFREEYEINPTLTYSLSKKLAEDICRAYENNYEMQIPIVRFFNVFGPRQDIYRSSPPLINYLVREFTQGNVPVLHSDGTQQRDYVHIDDVVRMLEIILEENFVARTTLNVCSGELLSVNDIVAYVRDALGTKIEPRYRHASKLWDTYPSLFEGPFPLNRALVEKETKKFSLGSNEKARQLIGWHPQANLKEAVQKTALEIQKNYNWA
ncbi:MAG: SDR family NAD(P)-dependent oxidoreductase [Candidatus Yanofskybacteria bacterium]|nr:SDR family NAD(P)-dependent oxidoreductase [Candidatus Yanofskybacteria bacterium]